jgi:DNA-binding transcriptional ArsR family regulator
MTTPLHQLKAEFFKTLGHPMRIRVLEMLSVRDRSVGEMLLELDVEASNLSQQLAVLRRSGLVIARREGSSVSYSLASDRLAELLAVARGILTTVLADQIDLLSDLRAEALPVDGVGDSPAPGQPEASRSPRDRVQPGAAMRAAQEGR